MKLAVLLTSHNRREKTVACLQALFNSEVPRNVSVEVIVVDDASTDGTSSAIAERFPSIKILSGNGSLYWNRGMHSGFGHALSIGYDFYLWLNDDTSLQPSALTLLFTNYFELEVTFGSNLVIVGATADAKGDMTYGGSIGISRVRRFQYRKVWDESVPTECDVMNGNCVLIPRAVAERVGNLDPTFEHAMGDTDYALRVRAAGGKIFVAPGFVGDCSRNSVRGTYLDRSLPLRARWKHILSPKGLPPRSWRHFTQRHGGTFWPLYFAWPYLKLLFR